MLAKAEARMRSAIGHSHVTKRIASVIALALPLSCLLCSTQAAAQADLRSPVTPERIERELKAIKSAAARHATDNELGELWALLASDYQDQMDIPRAEEAYDHSLKLLRGAVTARRSYAAVLDSLASLYVLTGQMAESENCRRKALAIFDAEGDQLNSLAVHGSLAVTLLKESKFKDAEKEASKEIDGTQGQVKPYANELVLALNVRSYARCLQRRCKDGLSDARQAVEIAQAFLRPNSQGASSSWSSLGYMEWKAGDVAGADEKMRRALQILNNENHDIPYPELVDTRISALKEYQQFLNGTHRKAEARQVDDEIARLTREQTPVCRNCTVNVEGLTNALH
jgi:Tfp pilus assembly protein PilF